MQNQSKKIRTRFAPSPTGFVHIGSLRTALFSFLFARRNKGVHVLRIEDTDQNRTVAGALENLLKVMKTMGVEFDEGFYLDDNRQVKERGEFGPYLQSKRLDLYQKYAKQLVDEKKAYYCFCTEQRLEDLRKEQTALKKPPMYDRLCHKLSAEEVKAKLDEFSAKGGSASGGKSAGKRPVIRFFIPEGKTIVRDLIYGDIAYEHKILDDQVILKSDGFPTYHLAVVVDDHFMEISHVIRGEEWLPSTPKHILLYEALGWQATEFAHLPLILNPDKSKLSKRQGDVSVEDFLSKGYLPEALLNFIAFLGWNPKTEQEIFTLRELIAEFDLAKVNKSGAVFDINKLDWINGQYIRKMPAGDLAAMLVPYWKKAGINTDNYSAEYLQAIASLEKERLKKLSEIGEGTGYFFAEPDYDPRLLIWKKRSGAKSAEALSEGGSDTAKTKQALTDLVTLLESLDESQFSQAALEENIKQMINSKSYDNGSVLWPLRVALTGLEKSPGPFEVAAVLAEGLGKQEVIKRLQTAIKKLA